MALLFLYACSHHDIKNVQPSPISDTALYSPDSLYLYQKDDLTSPPLSQKSQQIASISDLTLYPQDPMYFAQKYDATSLLLSPDEQTAYYADFRKKYFRAWTDTVNTTIKKKRNLEIYAYHINEIEKYLKSPGISHNKLLRDTLFIDNLVRNENIDRKLDTISPKKAIITTYAHVRSLPTFHPYFLDFSLAGEGYPFDYWQLSTIPIGTPIKVYFVGENWALIGSHICSGWVKRDHIAYIDDKTIEQIMSNPQIAITSDKIALNSSSGSYIGHADIGTVLSYTSEDAEHFSAIGIHKNTRGYAEIVTLNIPRANAQKIPIPATLENIAMLCQKMIGQTYGWGGLYDERDCSQTLLDLFIGFGILLPRNGKQQAYNFGTFADLSQFDTDSDKKAEIIDKGIPFFTLVRIPGHIMLYIGSENDEPLVFHTVWGLRTRDSNGLPARYILGKTLISTLQPGSELPDIDPDMTLIKRLEGITLMK